MKGGTIKPLPLLPVPFVAGGGSDRARKRFAKWATNGAAGILALSQGLSVASAKRPRPVSESVRRARSRASKLKARFQDANVCAFLVAEVEARRSTMVNGRRVGVTAARAAVAVVVNQAARVAVGRRKAKLMELTENRHGVDRLEKCLVAGMCDFLPSDEVTPSMVRTVHQNRLREWKKAADTFDASKVLIGG